MSSKTNLREYCIWKRSSTDLRWTHKSIVIKEKGNTNSVQAIRGEPWWMFEITSIRNHNQKTTMKTKNQCQWTMNKVTQNQLQNWWKEIKEYHRLHLWFFSIDQTYKNFNFHSFFFFFLDIHYTNLHYDNYQK